MELKRGVEFVEEDAGAVLFDANRGLYWHLNATGATLLARLLSGGDLESVVRDIALQAETAPRTVRKDCMKLLRQLHRVKLLIPEKS